MTYDITFCEGENCSRKEECHRYRELLRFRADKDPKKRLTPQCASRPTPQTAPSFGERKEARSMEKINGIVYHGKFYRALPGQIADIFEEQVNGVLRYTKISTHMVDGKLVEDVRRCRFRYSPSLTERLKGGGK